MNVVACRRSSVGGGLSNVVSGDMSFVGGGESNTVSGEYSGVGGGQGNAVASSSFHSIVFSKLLAGLHLLQALIERSFACFL